MALAQLRLAYRPLDTNSFAALAFCSSSSRCFLSLSEAAFTAGSSRISCLRCSVGGGGGGTALGKGPKPTRKRLRSA